MIQATIGWTQSHLYRFEMDGQEFGEPDPDFELPFKSAKATQLRAIAPAPGATLLYEYDFGDRWVHQVLVEKVLPPEPRVAYPRCLAGKRACPPEDVGGVPGYLEFLRAIRQPRHPGHDAMLEWAGGSFNPDAFDLDAVNDQLAHLGPGPWD